MSNPKLFITTPDGIQITNGKVFDISSDLVKGIIKTSPFDIEEYIVMTELSNSSIITTTYKKQADPENEFNHYHATQREVMSGEFNYKKSGELIGGTLDFGAKQIFYFDPRTQKLFHSEEELDKSPISDLRHADIKINQYGAITSGEYREKKVEVPYEEFDSSNLDSFFQGDWWLIQETASQNDTSTNEQIGETNTNSPDILIAPTKFNKKSADKITNFNPSTDALEIDTLSFGIDSSATFASGKNKKEIKKKLAKQDFDFLYDEKKGGLYFNENGADKGFGNGGIIAILKGAPELTSDNLEFI